MSRPYISDFSGYQEWLLPILVELKQEYTNVIRLKRGVISVSHLDRYVFPKVKDNANLETVEQEHILEAFFDAFCGTITMYGSDFAFDILERQVKGELPLC